MQNEMLPYEKFLHYGSESLSEEELLAIILRTGTKTCTAKQLASKVLSLSGEQERGLNFLHHLSVQQLMQVPGIGEVKAVKLKCIAEFAKRMAREKVSRTLKFCSPSSVANYYMEEMRHEEKERVLILSLDNKLCLIEENVLSVGTVNASLLSTREVFIEAIKNKASNVMLLHNHPSGDPTPSKQDLQITEKVREAGDLLEIPLVDHIIIGDQKYCSFKELGILVS